MKAYICDRCGETYTGNKVPTIGRISGGYLSGFYLMSSHEEFDSRVDLCDDCLNDLFKFMGNQTVYKVERVEAQ